MSNRIFSLLLIFTLILGAYSSKPISFRSFSKVFKSVASLGISASLYTFPASTHAFGPIEITLENMKYKQVDLCNGKKPIMPGQKAMEGLYAVCIEVDADAVNPSGKSLKDVSVYGFVKVNNLKLCYLSVLKK
jgi:hypothetical protein